MTLCVRWALSLRVAALGLALAGIWQIAGRGSNGAEPVATTAEQVQFFEEKVRPVLAANCQDCHGVKKQESGLRLDSRAAALDGGDSGDAAVVPGDPERSLLVKAINHVGDFQMPPKRKMSAEEIAALTEWVRAGAHWPAAESAAVEKKLPVAELATQHRQSHWAYQAVRRPALPDLQIANCVLPSANCQLQNSIDAFVAARLTAQSLTLSPRADRRTLIRRLSFDLIGLPPAMAEVEAFAADMSPDAYERLVDRLLASPRYGERWGRHWLDVARYGDTKGYAFAQERRYPYAYTYRDYVIRAFNEDLPYDQFILEQLAADRLIASPESLAPSPQPPVPSPEPPADKSRLAALGFLTTGRKFNSRNDDIDDQIDVVCRGILGITVACARCHDHKYDAIPTEDYYSLFGVFANSAEPAELPLIAPLDDSPESRMFAEGLDKLKDEVEKFAAEKHGEFLDQSRRQAADYLARVAAGDSNNLLAKLPFMSLDPKDLRPRLLERWRRYLDERAKPDDPVLGLWHDLLRVPSDAFAEQAPAALARWQSLPAGTHSGECNPVVRAAFSEETLTARMDVPRIYGQLFTAAYDRWRAAGADAKALESLADDWRQIAEVVVGKDSPTDVGKDDIRQYLNRADRNKHTELQKKVESYQANSPLAPPRAMVVADSAKMAEPRVLIRGNPARPGNVVPRQFLLVLAGESRQPFRDGSGRLELARAIASPDNPLTRRVIVNRLWMHHFGEPLVATPSDFGIRTEAPPQAELLDSLAADLLDAGWSLKALHRQIVCSATYQQASLDRPDCRQIDPENRLLWRMNRRRLELEAVRDTLLAAAGQLDLAMYGRAVELTKSPYPRRRAVYGFIDRQDLPNLFRVFDIASPDSSSPRRPRTTVPQQALFFMNSPFVIEQAKALAARPEVTSAGDRDAQIAALYHLVLNRPPDNVERTIALDFLAEEGHTPTGTKLSAMEQWSQLLLLANEGMYID